MLNVLFVLCSLSAAIAHRGSYVGHLCGHAHLRGVR